MSSQTPKHLTLICETCRITFPTKSRFSQHLQEKNRRSNFGGKDYFLCPYGNCKQRFEIETWKYGDMYAGALFTEHIAQHWN
ncbi:hypothetical protein EJ08DRAFT_645240 [Tothia fuscella]|uniref:Uncharacterized protein n=1 Tax=Tothia fuscella TaxID=1048955 RepID=A0A9P4U2X7_9PEZI|nr:hypothetical protein EJ08DRAFT_645240 [Tothia fuscella]